MITAKEKAKELVDKFLNLKPTKLSDYSKIYLPTAKQCAKIAVEEIIYALDDVNEIDYYVHVLKEIENYENAKLL